MDASRTSKNNITWLQHINSEKRCPQQGRLFTQQVFKIFIMFRIVLVALILLVERERRDQERKRKWRGKEKRGNE
jgi:sensor domain CHASE-containing protein